MSLILLKTDNNQIVQTNLYSIRCSTLIMTLRETLQQGGADTNIITLLGQDMGMLCIILEWLEYHHIDPDTYDYEHVQLTSFDRFFLQKYSTKWQEIFINAKKLYIIPLILVMEKAMLEKQLLESQVRQFNERMIELQKRRFSFENYNRSASKYKLKRFKKK